MTGQIYTQTYRQWSGRTKPGRLIGRVSHVIKHTEAGADISPAATVAQEVARCRAIDAFHASLGWGGVGYHTLVFPSGRVYEGRGYGRAGVHTAGRNGDTIAACTPGHGDRTPMTPAGILATRAWIGEGIRRGHISTRPQVSGHRDHAAKSCPGHRIYPQLPRLRDVTEGDAPMTPTQQQEVYARLDQIAAAVGGLDQRVRNVETVTAQTSSRVLTIATHRWPALRRNIRRIGHRLQLRVPQIERGELDDPDTIED